MQDRKINRGNVFIIASVFVLGFISGSAIIILILIKGSI